MARITARRDEDHGQCSEISLICQSRSDMQLTILYSFVLTIVNNYIRSNVNRKLAFCAIH